MIHSEREDFNPSSGIYERDDNEVTPYIMQLYEYFKGTRKEFNFPIDLKGTEFQRLVWEYLQTIGYGEVRSYQEVSQAIGRPISSRAVGGAVRCNQLPIVVPCHRVIGANGTLVGYVGGLKIKEALLRREGFLT